jgi:hypothetical protein
VPLGKPALDWPPSKIVRLGKSAVAIAGSDLLHSDRAAVDRDLHRWCSYEHQRLR